MANTKDFKVKNGIKPTVYHEAVGTVVSGSEGYYLAGASYDSKSFSVASQASLPIGSAIKSDGTSYYVIDNITDNVFQYDLSTAWDISTASYASKSFSVSSQTTSPVALAISSDGTKMYAGAGGTIYQYTLSTAWDISTASYASLSYTNGTNHSNLRGILFKPDGTKVYIGDIGGTPKDIFQYSLSTPWNISTASYDSKTLVVTSTVGEFGEMDFNADGSRFFIQSGDNDAVYQYSLGTAYDISTASYDSVSFITGSQDAFSRGFIFGDSGTRFYIVGDTNDTIYQYSTALITNTLDLSTGSVFEITPTSDIQVSLSNPADSGTVSGATLLLESVATSTYDIANASYDSVDLTVASSNVTGLYFKADGSSFYVAKGTGSNLYRYDMTTAWDISTGTLGQTYDYDLASGYIAGGDARGIFFKSDGLKYYVLSGTNDQICEITVTTPWSLSVGFSLTDTFSVSGQDTQPYGLFFKPDGTKMYVTGYTNDRVYQYTLSTAWDLSTASYDSVSFSFASQEGTPENVVFTDDGLTMFMLGSTDVVFKYTLSTAWNVSTASYSGTSFSVNSQDTAAKGFYFKAGGEKLYVAGDTNNKIYQYSTATPATITYPSNITWPGGTAPTSPAIGETDVLTFTTRDGGTTYNAALAIDGAQ